MRSVPSAALAKINAQYGTESVLLVRFVWGGGQHTDFATKSFPSYGVQGRITALSEIDDVTSLDSGSNSSSITVSLSDPDLGLLNLFNRVDLYSVRIEIRQWFPGLDISQSFLLFNGQINTPLSYDEGKRQLTFTVMTILENLEFGFSADESLFNVVPLELIGTPWPVVFGSVIQSPCLQIYKQPSIITAEGFAIVDEEMYEADLQNCQNRMTDSFDNATAAYAASTAASRIAALYHDGVEHSYVTTNGRVIVDNPPDDEGQYISYFNQSVQLLQQFDQYMNEMRAAQLEFGQLLDDFEQKKAYAKTQIRVITADAPTGPLTVIIQGRWYNVVVAGGVMNIGEDITPDDQQQVYVQTKSNNYGTSSLSSTTQVGDPVSSQYNGTGARQKFTWIAGGTKLLVQNYPLKYVAGVGVCGIAGVYGKQQGAYVALSTTDYTVSIENFTNDFHTLQATCITTRQPLTSYIDEFNEQVWDDNTIYVNITGPVAGRMVDILAYSIQTYSTFQYDPGSFGVARLFTDSIPMNHVVRDRYSTFDYLKEIAYQGKCSLWLKDNVIYIRHLPVTPTPVDSIVSTDILENTLTIFTTDTESITTKLTAKWKFSEAYDQDNVTSYRYNIPKFGVIEDEHEFFAFNDLGSVNWSATYWVMRKANYFKKIKFRTDLSKIRLESFDAVTVNLTSGSTAVADIPVIGIVESSVYDATDSEVELTIWLPVRAGEMLPYDFAYPYGLNLAYADPTDDGVDTGNPFQNVNDNNGFFAPPVTTFQGATVIGKSPYNNTPMDGDPSSIGTTEVNTFIVGGVGGSVNKTKPADIKKANDYKQVEVNPLVPVTVPDDSAVGTYFGTVQGQIDDGGGTTYNVLLYGADTPVEVEQVLIGRGIIPTGTPTFVFKFDGLYYMQVPTWLDEEEEEDD